jgi:hypothetical protein
VTADISNELLGSGKLDEEIMSELSDEDVVEVKPRKVKSKTSKARSSGSSGIGENDNMPKANKVVRFAVNLENSDHCGERYSSQRPCRQVETVG